MPFIEEKYRVVKEMVRELCSTKRIEFMKETGTMM
jgi:hypothetical protein